jgi:hypothetical protein
MTWRRKAGILLAVLGCVIGSLVVWDAGSGMVAAVPETPATSRRSLLWPLPGLYLLEVGALSLVAAAGAWRGSGALVVAAWFSIGALAGLSVLGAWSIGPYVAATTAVVGLGVFLAGERTSGLRRRKLLAFLLGAAAQVALMVIVIRLR